MEARDPEVVEGDVVVDGAPDPDRPARPEIDPFVRHAWARRARGLAVERHVPPDSFAERPVPARSTSSRDPKRRLPPTRCMVRGGQEAAVLPGYPPAR